MVGSFFVTLQEAERGRRVSPLHSPAGENLKHNTHVAAQPNPNADGAFRPSPSIGLLDGGVRGAGGGRLGGGGGGGGGGRDRQTHRWSFLVSPHR